MLVFGLAPILIGRKRRKCPGGPDSAAANPYADAHTYLDQHADAHGDRHLYPVADDRRHAQLDLYADADR